MTRVTLLTDFGTGDGYVAAMRGVIATIAPRARIEDATHDIRPGDVEAAAWALRTYWRWYPAGTVHLAVVDPGVGTARRAIAAEVDGRRLVAPDNGLLTWVLRDGPARVHRIDEAAVALPELSATFHGRDLFAPAAARLATGLPIDALGPGIADPVLLELPVPRRAGDALVGRVAHVDRFGNLITDLTRAMVEEMAGGAEVEVRVGATSVGPLRRTYGDAAPGALLALIGSGGLLEVSERDGSAATRLGAGRGAEVRVSPRSG